MNVEWRASGFQFIILHSAFIIELFPTKQSHLLCFSLGEKFQIELTVTKAIQQRFVSALTVAVAMTLAALYGIINRRPQASLASLTIAFLSGGAVSGMNVMTCINRAAGTCYAFVHLFDLRRSFLLCMVLSYSH